MGGYLGIDLGATNNSVAVADGDGSIVARVDRSTPNGPTGEAITATIIDSVRAVCDEADVSPTALSGACIGSIGPLDHSAGAVAMGVNIDGDIGRIQLRGPIADLIDAPVEVLNDAIAGAVGERKAIEPAPDHLVYLTISTGIGVGAIVDGRVLAGRNGNAGEMGHVVVDPGERLVCGCGGAGHWEAYCSGRHLPDFARRLAAETETHLPLDGLTAATIFEHASDPLASRTLAEMSRYNAIGLATTIHAFAPDVVTVGGAVALENPDEVIGPMRRRVGPMLAVETPEIRAAALGADSVLRGAIQHALTTTGP